MLNMLPKWALVAMKTFPRIRECRRPSRTPYKNTQILIGN